MPDHGVLPDVIERFLDEPIPVPPLADLRAAGERNIRRRRARTLAGAGTAVLVVVAAVVAGQAIGRARDADPTPRPAAVPEPLEGTRWAGIGKVVLAVPAVWSDGATRCGQATEDTVFFQSDGVIDRCGIRGRHSSLAISDEPFLPPIDANTVVDRVVDGHAIQTTQACFHAVDGPCVAFVGAPDLGAYFRVHVYALDAEAQVQAIVDSLTVLPETAVTVPEVPLRIDAARAAIERAGLTPVVETVPCESPRGCHARTTTAPPPGHVVTVGSEITIEVVPPGNGGPDYLANVDGGY